MARDEVGERKGKAVAGEGARGADEWRQQEKGGAHTTEAWCVHAVVTLEVVHELLCEVEVFGQGDTLLGELVGQLPACRKDEWRGRVRRLATRGRRG
jgi:hypothetical protein